MNEEQIESFKSVLRKSSLSELGQMTISFMDVQQFQQSVSVPLDLNNLQDLVDDANGQVIGGEPEANEVKICERKESDYSFTDRDIIPGCITGTDLLRKIKLLIPNEK